MNSTMKTLFLFFVATLALAVTQTTDARHIRGGIAVVDRNLQSKSKSKAKEAKKDEGSKKAKSDGKDKAKSDKAAKSGDKAKSDKSEKRERNLEKGSGGRDLQSKSKSKA